MTVIPHFHMPVGTEITLFANRFAVNGKSGSGYEVTNLEGGEITVVPFSKLVEHLRLPGVSINTELPATGDRLKARLDGYTSARALPGHQLENGRFRLAICEALDLLENKIREDTGRSSFELSIRAMDKPENRRFIQRIAQELFDQKIHLSSPRGGKSTGWHLPKGRTLKKFFREYKNLHPSESPLNALVSLDHRKGNRLPRITHRTRELMTDVWERIGLDTKKPNMAGVLRELEGLIREENQHRRANQLPDLILPSSSTLSAHRNSLLTPTEQLVATTGLKNARNKRGRGSSDIRALLVGECVEIDECKASLVVSAKEKGLWEKLSDDERTTLEEIDQLIRDRLIILVMIDIASRMPLAWVISDQPRAEATLALFRMATRSKEREARMYGCSGEPVAAIGIGNVKHDNGAGLRNSATVGALLGIGAMDTAVRTYSPTDKPYVERMFGTIESVLLNLIHGYTGRKPGDLPGYDAQRNGVLNIDELNGILTRFMIDEYPSMRHMGIGMGGRRPFEVYKELAQMPGCFPPIDPNIRRIHLGWEELVTPTDEGIRVFSGIWFNSPELQEAREHLRKGEKASVFVDPDDMNHATVLLPRIKHPICVQLQISAFADMSLPEILNLMAAWRKEDPKSTEVHEDRLYRTRRDRRDLMNRIGVERNLGRSYSTVEECRKKAAVVMQGARVIRNVTLAGTVQPGSITDETGPDVFRIGDDAIIDAIAMTDGPFVPLAPAPSHDHSEQVHEAENLPEDRMKKPVRKRAKPSINKDKVASERQLLGRPTDMKGFAK